MSRYLVYLINSKFTFDCLTWIALLTFEMIHSWSKIYWLFQNTFSNNYKLLLIATSLILTFTVYNIPFTVRIFTRYEVLIRKSVNLNIWISFYKGLKMQWLTSFPNIFNKEITWLKINKWAVYLFWCSSDLHLYPQVQEPNVTLYENC